MATPAPLWTDDETADVWLAWEHFRVLHPERDYSAWLNKRLREKRKLRAGQADTPKPKPVIAPSPTEEYDDDDLLEAAIRYQEEITRAFPNVREHQVEVPTDEPIAIAFPSDWHIGSEGCDLARIRADCELIASHPRLYVGLGGDPIDNFILSKMGSAARSQTQQVQVQWRLFRKCVQIIQDSLLWVSSGNHDAWTQTVAGIDGVLAALAGIPVCYTGEGGWIHIKVGTQTYTIYRKHKPLRYNSSFNRSHWIKQMTRIELPLTFDVAVSEHLHEANVEMWAYKGAMKVLLALGSYKIMDRWAEGGGYYNGGYGVPTLVFYPDRHKILCFWSIEDALEVLDGGASARPAAA